MASNGNSMRRHDPVLYDECIAEYDPALWVAMDGTLGHGGHTAGLIQKWLDAWRWWTICVWVDRDLNMATKAESFLWPLREHCTFVHGSYAETDRCLEANTWEKFAYVLLDIGVNMDHFKEADRGFSIKKEWPLDMRYDTSAWVPLSQRLPNQQFQTLVDTFIDYADMQEKKAKELVKELQVRVKKNWAQTTWSLQAFAAHVWVSDKRLAVIFQALRIALNQELDHLDSALSTCKTLVKSSWKLLVISYHSGEDRRVKTTFKAMEQQWVGHQTTKRVITPHRQEVKRNKAARSAKLRIFQFS